VHQHAAKKRQLSRLMRRVAAGEEAKFPSQPRGSGGAAGSVPHEKSRGLGFFAGQLTVQRI